MELARLRLKAIYSHNSSGATQRPYFILKVISRRQLVCLVHGQHPVSKGSQLLRFEAARARPVDRCSVSATTSRGFPWSRCAAVQVSSPYASMSNQAVCGRRTGQPVVFALAQGDRSFIEYMQRNNIISLSFAQAWRYLAFDRLDKTSKDCCYYIRANKLMWNRVIPFYKFVILSQKSF